MSTARGDTAQGRQPHPASYTYAVPVAWTPDRDRRGAARPSGPRCPHPGCPVRWLSGEDRLCREHAPPPPELTSAQRVMIRAALAVARTPARRRIVRELMRDAARSNRSVAQAAGTNHMRVRAVRLEMEAAGLVAPFRARSRRRTPSLATPARDLARLALARDPARPNRQVAQEAAVSYPVVMRVRHQMEDAGDIKRYRGPSRNGT